MAGTILVSLVLLALLLLILILLVVYLHRRQRGRKGSKEHVYEAIVPQETHAEVIVLPNKAYEAAQSSPTDSLPHGSIQLNIRETYNNLTINLNHLQ